MIIQATHVPILHKKIKNKIKTCVHHKQNSIMTFLFIMWMHYAQHVCNIKYYNQWVV